MLHSSEFDQKTGSFVPSTFLPNDEGVYVKDLLKLVQYSPLAEKLIELMGFNDIKEEFIKIPGAKTLLAAVDAESKRFLKVDVESDYLDLKFEEDSANKSIGIVFSNLNKVTFPNSSQEVNEHLLEEGYLVAKPVYAAKSTFFGELHSLSNYANDLLKSGHGQLVLRNLEMLKEIFTDAEDRLVKKYRLLKDRGDNYFLRGIVSKKYVDYNIGVSVFIALISLHKNMVETGENYSISLCEYSESFIRVFFQKTGNKKIGDICRVKYIIELSNDEIKREALRFSGIASIEYNKGDEVREIYLAPKSIDFSICSVFHSYSPETAVEKLEFANNITAIENRLYDDISFIEEIKEPDQIRHLLQRKVGSDTNIKPFITGELTKELDSEVGTIHQLLDIMFKLDVAVSDIEIKEYLRYLLYNMVKEEKDRREKEKEKEKAKGKK